MMINYKKSFELMYETIFIKIIQCPIDYLSIVQEYRDIRKVLQDSNDEYDYYKFNEDLKIIYASALQDAYNIGKIDSSSYLLWKKLDGDDLFLED